MTERNMPETENDYFLIKSFLDGDNTAFNKIINKYRQKIYWHARKMTGNHLDADEIVQEVMLVIYKKLKDFRSESSLYTWIYRITSTRSLNLIKSRNTKRTVSYDDPDTPEAVYKNDIVEDIDQKDKLKKLDILLQELPPKQREVFIFRNMDGLSYEEISEITGKSTGALKANYFHALNKLSEMMKNEFE